MIQVTIYKPDGNTLNFTNVTSVSTENGVLKFDHRPVPGSQYAYNTVKTTCTYYIEETFGQG